MPERFTRVLIHNTSASLTLVRTFTHLCGGDWTPGGWQPPAAIGPGTTGGMQSEGDTFPPTGTEGYVKYDVMSASGRAGMIYVHWSNPLLGALGSWPKADATDVFPDCDFDKPEGSGSAFAPPPLGFVVERTAFRHFHGSEPATSFTEILAAGGPVAAGSFAGLPVGAFLGLGLQLGVKDPEWHYTFREVAVSASSGLTETVEEPPPAGVSVPNVVGLGRDDAVAFLATEGYQSTVQFTPSAELDNIVALQQPPAGAPVAPPAVVTLSIGGGPADVEPPHVDLTILDQ